MALLLALSVWMARLPRERRIRRRRRKQQDFDAIKDLGVLENYDVLTKFDALSEVPADDTSDQPQAQPPSPDSNGGQQPPSAEE